ncbi:aminotransferase class V-fold PLP-dependent enzyme [Oligoflexus tunisiensis]|uniref:aminotransferase class V-fold PLP-dependent enzyme n=1 Tax=Oligoflexus tunisiensis TaxID=708132 RepID=UPI000B332161|nr:aminotransferase class V-fold PLP-dependent enzyme [Oligoflexus tunisiensis]
MDKDFRTYFASKPGLIHLNNAGLSPINIKAEAIVHHWAERYRREGMFCHEAGLEAIEESRQDLAQFLDAESGSLAFFSCTSAAVSQVAFQIDLKPGQEVLMWDQENGSHLYPWQEACQRSGAQLVLAASAPDLGTPVERLLSQVTERTRVIAVSWVQFQTGALTDLEPLVALKKDRDLWIVVDGIQAIGARPFSFRNMGIDALMGGSHKWMTSLAGAAYLCIKPERARELRPHNVGAQTLENGKDARRYESGSRPVLEILALGTSARLIRGLGPARLMQKSLELSQMLADGLSDLGYQVARPNGPRLTTPLINVTAGARTVLGDVEAISHALQKNKISHARRGQGLRLSPHAHNNRDDILETLRVFSGKFRSGL